MSSPNIVLVSDSHKGLPNPKSNPDRRWMVGFNRQGRPRKAYRVNRRHNGARLTIQKIDIRIQPNISMKHLTTIPPTKKKQPKRTSKQRRRYLMRIKRRRKKRIQKMRRNKKRRRKRKLRICIRRNGKSSQKCARYRSKSYKKRQRTERPTKPASTYRSGRKKPKVTSESAAFVLDPL